MAGRALTALRARSPRARALWYKRHVDSLTFPSGTGRVVVECAGGRVAELRPADDAPNLLWLGDTAPVAGGDRLWVAPEVEIFYETPEPEGWRCPPELDPGEWSLERVDGTAVLEQSALGASLRRRIGPLEDLRAPTELAWTGYRVVDEVEASSRWSAWHIVPVPAPARLYVRDGSDPVVYYAPRPDEIEGWIDARDAEPRWKVGYPAPADGKVVLAAMDDDDPGGLIVLLSAADPEGTYVDVPLGEESASAVQVFGSGGRGYCELEHHAPLETRRAASVVVGAWGSRQERLWLLAALEAKPPSLEGD